MERTKCHDDPYANHARVVTIDDPTLYEFVERILKAKAAGAEVMEYSHHPVYDRPYANSKHIGDVFTIRLEART